MEGQTKWQCSDPSVNNGQIAVLKSSMHTSIYWTNNANIVHCKLNMTGHFEIWIIIYAI